MSLILCRRECVERPFYVEALGVHIYSSQELCYVILQHPFLVMDAFVTDALRDFISKELELPQLAAKMEALLEEDNSDEALLAILNACDYASTEEITAYRQKLDSLRKMPPALYLKEKADYYYKNRQYGMAVSTYEKILVMPKEIQKGDAFMGEVWQHLAASYVNLFYFDKALHALEKACDRTGGKNPLKQMYFLSKLSPHISLRERYLAAMTEEWKKLWDEEFEQVKESVQQSENWKKIEEVFAGETKEARLAAASKMVAGWKEAYRREVVS